VGLATTDHPSLSEAKKSLLGNAAVRRTLANAEKKTEFNALIPLRARAQTVKGNTLLVGDAAGQVKATTGGGIVFGAKCGRVLAECVARGEPSAYEREWRREASALKWHARLRGLYDSMGERRVGLLLASAKVLGGEWLLSRFGDMDYVLGARHKQ